MFNHKPFFRSLLIFLVAFSLGYLVLARAAAINRARSTSLVRSFDYRVKGVMQGGWTLPKFTFTEEHLYFFGAKINLLFAGSERSLPQTVIITAGSTTQQFSIPKNGAVLAPSPLNKSTPINLSIVSTEPSNTAGGNQLGPKLLSVSIDGSRGILFPAISSVVCLLLLFSLTVTCTVFLLAPKNSRIASLIVFSFLSLLFFLHREAIFDHWPRAAWLWGFFATIQLGIILQRTIDNGKANQQCQRSTLLSLLPVMLVTLLALWIRISVIDFGLPNLYHPDESRKIGIAKRIVETSNWDPNYFRHPSFMVYSTATLGKISHLVTGEYPDVPKLAKLGRSVSATLGSLSVIVIFLIGRLLFGDIAGIYSAVILAVAPLHVVCSRYIKEDVCMIFFMLASFYCTLYFCYKSPRLRWLLASGLLAGFATSVKYTGVLSVSFLLAPLLLRLLAFVPVTVPFVSSALSLPIQNIPLKKVLAFTLPAVFLSAVGFLLITPYSVLNSVKFLDDFFSERDHMNRGHTGAFSARAFFWTYHLKLSVLPGLTPLAAIVAIGSLGVLLGEGTIASVALLLGVLLFYFPAEFVNAKPFPQPERYILPCIPFLALAIGGAVQATIHFVKDKRTFIPFNLILLALLLLPLSYSLHHRSAVSPDTRTLATTWVNENLPKGASILTDWSFYGPQYDRTRFHVRELKLPENQKLLQALSLDRIIDEKVDYFITSSFFYDRYLWQVKRGNKTGIGFDEIFKTLTPIAVFDKSPYNYGFHNPIIRVYKIPKPE